MSWGSQSSLPSLCHHSCGVLWAYLSLWSCFIWVLLWVLWPLANISSCHKLKMCNSCNTQSSKHSVAGKKRFYLNFFNLLCANLLYALFNMMSTKSRFFFPLSDSPGDSNRYGIPHRDAGEMEWNINVKNTCTLPWRLNTGSLRGHLKGVLLLWSWNVNGLETYRPEHLKYPGFSAGVLIRSWD